MKKQRILSLVLVLTMVMSMLTFNITVSQAATTTVDPTDFSAFEAYGAYVYASQSEDAEVHADHGDSNSCTTTKYWCLASSSDNITEKREQGDEWSYFTSAYYARKAAEGKRDKNGNIAFFCSKCFCK